MSRTWLLVLGALGLLVFATIGGYHWLDGDGELPPGFIAGNGRVEADEVDVATKYPGRLLEITVAEGDVVARGQEVARLDPAELQAQLRQAEAQARQLERTMASAASQLEQRRSELALADRDVRRSEQLAKDGYIPAQRLDELRTRASAARSAARASEFQLQAAREAVLAAEATVEQLRVRLAETRLNAPIDGRVLYRLAEPGEVLPAGGRVLTLLDLTDVYMTIFLPAAAAARLPVGSEARIVLDALPDLPLPAQVSFVSPEAQFTPKEVETRSEREKLMFRVKLRVPEALLRRSIDRVKTGVTGVGYVRLDPQVPWPAWLESRLTQPAAPAAPPSPSPDAPTPPPESSATAP